MDTIFFLTLLIIFLGALVSNILKWRKKDRVLKDLQDFHTTFEMLDGKRIWGETFIFANGMELKFSRQMKNDQGDPIASYIFYNDDIDQIRTIYRRHGELSSEDKQRRKKEVDSVSNPDLLMKLNRWLRIIFNMFNDAIGEALNAFISRMKGTAGGASIFSAQGDQIGKLGTTALSAVGNAYDPMIERYINRRVIVSLNDALRKDEFCGFLKEYSSAWLSIVDCNLTDTHDIELDDLERLSLQRDMDICYTLRAGSANIVLDVQIEYYGDAPLKIIAITGENYKHPLDKILAHGQSISFSLDELPQAPFDALTDGLLPLEFKMITEARRVNGEAVQNRQYQNILPDYRIQFESEHSADVYVPRALAVLRHACD